MDFAKIINFKTFIDESEWCGKIDSAAAGIPRECDFAAATAAMLRRDVLKNCGGMDEEFFIYYDDIEFGYRIKTCGYKVISLGTAKAWHKSGMRQKTTTTFARYYLTRNRYRFFAKYMPEEDIPRFAEHILHLAFSRMYGSYYKGRMDIFNTEKYILEDFICDKRGKAGIHRINEIQKKTDPLIEQNLAGCNDLLIEPEQGIPLQKLIKWCQKIRNMNPRIKIVINHTLYLQNEQVSCLEQWEKKFPEVLQYIAFIMNPDKKKYDKIIRFCRHVKDTKNNILPEIYMDLYGNIIATDQDYFYFRNYENSYDFFKAIYHDSLIERIHKIRKEGILCQRYLLSPLFSK